MWVGKGTSFFFHKQDLSLVQSESGSFPTLFWVGNLPDPVYLSISQFSLPDLHEGREGHFILFSQASFCHLFNLGRDASRPYFVSGSFPTLYTLRFVSFRFPTFMRVGKGTSFYFHKQVFVTCPIWVGKLPDLKCLGNI